MKLSAPSVSYDKSMFSSPPASSALLADEVISQREWPLIVSGGVSTDISTDRLESVSSSLSGLGASLGLNGLADVDCENSPSEARRRRIRYELPSIVFSMIMYGGGLRKISGTLPGNGGSDCEIGPASCQTVAGASATKEDSVSTIAEFHN